MTAPPDAVFVIGVGLHPAAMAERGLRLEEMVHHTSRRALDHAGISRRQLDNVVLGASDELDGRPISSMLLAAPAGAYLTDEIKVTDSGATALCLAYARIHSGEFHAGLVASWCKSSKSDVEAVMRLRAEPIFLRPLGMDARIADGLFAQAMGQRFGIGDDEANRRAHTAALRAQANPRGLRREPASIDDVGRSSYGATPIRAGHRAPASDGAVALVLASAHFLRSNPQCKPLARITGAGWASDSYLLGGERLGGMNSARKAWAMALGQTGLLDGSALDLVELESPTSWHEAAYVRAFGLRDEVVSPSGGCFAQNPLIASGLVNAAEAVLQVAGQAGAVQRPNVLRAAAHSCHGYAQQGNVVITFEKVDAQ